MCVFLYLFSGFNKRKWISSNEKKKTFRLGVWGVEGEKGVIKESDLIKFNFKNA